MTAGSTQTTRRRRRPSFARAMTLAAAATLAVTGCAVNSRRAAPAADPVSTLLPSPSSCPRAGQFWLRSSTAASLVGELAGDTAATVAAATGDGAATESRGVRGRIVRVVQAGGMPADVLPSGEGAAAAGAPEAVLVLWGSIGDCRPAPLPPEALVAEPGERVFISGTLRPREQWVAGRPTLDVYATPHLYVPSRERARWAGTRDSIPAEASLMTADEYFAFYQALPTRDEWDRHSTFARRRLRRWLRGNAALVAKEPAARVVRDLEAGRRRKY